MATRARLRIMTFWKERRDDSTSSDLSRSSLREALITNEALIVEGVHVDARVQALIVEEDESEKRQL